ncbi:GldG family protein [Iningainema tapete]|uniref:Gldg family protein n=1 Tax=Iningainema tapete BLCC-T55 TaxID=2748662 RepID=A0A8J7C8Z9_9CYAN|nr:Gldg family protein [Iningainema tapete]MBD2775351.1 Gldg family protein [Iningainema tapete BLCC-T55]
MKIIAKNKWKYLFWFGPFLLTAGLTAGLASDSWGTLPSALIISGIVIIGLWVIWQSYYSKWWSQRSTQVSTNALVATTAVLVILGLVNFLGTRYHFRTDVTETQLFTLAPQSRQLLRSLSQPVKVWIFAINQNSQDRQLLENYQRYSSRFKFEYVDPQAKPILAAKFGVKENNGEVYLESGDKRQLVQVVNEQERLSELSLTNRLQQIVSPSTVKVYFLQGHGEHQLSLGEGGMSQAVQGLGDRNFTTSALNLTEKSSIPQDATVVVIAGIKRGLFDTEVKALQDYLNRGGNLLLLIDPGTDAKLDNLLAEWGVQLDYRLAVDQSGEMVGFGPAVAFVTTYGKHPITQDFGNGISFYRLARPIDTIVVPEIEATPLLLTQPYPETWAESDLESENLQFNPQSDRKGPLTLGVALRKKIIPQVETLRRSVSTPTSNPTPTGQSVSTPTSNPTPTGQSVSTPPSNPKVSQMVVIGDSDFATDGLFGQQLNKDVFLNSVSWLSQQEQQSLSIRPKEVKNRRLNITIAQAHIITWSSLLVLPILALAGSVILWWRRR